MTNANTVMLNEVQSKIVRFILGGGGGKRAKIRFDVLKCPKEQGGLRLVDLKVKHTSLLCQWVLYANKDEFLARAMYQELAPNMGKDIWLTNLSPGDVDTMYSYSFWKYVLKAWSKYNYRYRTL